MFLFIFNIALMSLLSLVLIYANDNITIVFSA